MQIVVFGLWHLGCVTAACCARHFSVTGVDFDSKTIRELSAGKAPIHEPGLDELIVSGLRQGRLTFSDDPIEPCSRADVVWLTYDTPINDNDESDVSFVLGQYRRCLPYVRPGAVILISSQLPVGMCRVLETEFSQFSFAYSPENLRLGRALDAFERAERIVAGIRDHRVKPVLEKLFKPFTSQILWMRPESAEMVKHGLNAFLALSIAFVNELARLCEQTGADAGEVSDGLKSDSRIGSRAYLVPGAAFAGGTLARDVVTLTRLGLDKQEPLMVIPAIKESNDQHRKWAARKLESKLGFLGGRTIAVLGLTYTANTNTLRRSLAIELVRQLVDAGARVRAFDSAVKELPANLSNVHSAESLDGALAGADAAVVCMESPELHQADWGRLLMSMNRRLVVDPNGFLEKELGGHPSVEHISVGRS